MHQPSVYHVTVVIHDNILIFSLTGQHNKHGTSYINMDPRYSPTHPLLAGLLATFPVLPPPAPLLSVCHPPGELDLDDCIQPPNCLFWPMCPLTAGLQSPNTYFICNKFISLCINVTNIAPAGCSLTQLPSPYPPFSDNLICNKFFSYYEFHLLSN